MNEHEKDRFFNMLKGAIATGANPKPLDSTGFDLWWYQCKEFSFDELSRAFTKHNKTKIFSPTIAHIVALINKHVSAEEAWGIYPKGEHQTAFVTQEMHDAFKACEQLLLQGDEFNASKAFIKKYDDSVGESITGGRRPTWRLSEASEGSPEHRSSIKIAAYNDAHQMGFISDDRLAIALQGESDKNLCSNYKLLEGKVEQTESAQKAEKEGLEGIRKLRDEILNSSKKITKED